MCADGPLLPPLSSPTAVDTVATAVTTHHHATAAVAHNFARCYILSSHPVIPSGHHHPVITIPSSPSSPARGADLLGVDPRISTARRHLHPQAHRHRADLRTMSLAARAEDRPTRRTLKATWT